MAVEIPLGSEGSQEFTITIDSTTYTFNVSYNTRVGIWTLNISVGNQVIVNGLGLLGGVDIIKQIPSPLKNLFIVNLDNPNLDATADNLGTSVRLFKLSDEEVLQIG